MFEEQTQWTNPPGSTTRTAIAIVLLALAIPLGIWVLTIVNTTIKDKETPALLQKIYPEEDKPVTINTPNGKIELPAQFFKGFSYMVLFVFLLIPTTIATALLKGSITLLKPDLTTKMMRGLVESVVKIQPPKE
jgi:hypothetical protein